MKWHKLCISCESVDEVIGPWDVQDKRFVAPTLFQCFAPRIFLSREEEMNRTFGKVSIKRPMDAMKVKVSNPPFPE